MQKLEEENEGLRRRSEEFAKRISETKSNSKLQMVNLHNEINELKRTLKKVNTENETLR